MAHGRCSCVSLTGAAPFGHSSKGMSTCVPCPPGSYDVERASCSCPPGTMRISGATNATAAAEAVWAGLTSPANIDFQCVDCAAGTYSETVDADGCSGCPAGTCSTAVGSASFSSCTTCPANTHTSTEGSVSCTACPDNSTDVRRVGCACDPGHYRVSVNQSLACTPCPMGSFAEYSDVTECELCLAGTFSAEQGATGPWTCTDCPTDHYSADGASSCALCPHHADDNSKTSCSCVPGYVRVQGVGAESNFTCEECPRGYYSTAYDSPSCEACLAGTYSSQLAAAAMCRPCDPDTFSPEGFWDCIPCPTGSSRKSGVECEQASALSANVTVAVRECAAGEYFFDSIQCLPCPLGGLQLHLTAPPNFPGPRSGYPGAHTCFHSSPSLLSEGLAPGPGCGDVRGHFGNSTEALQCLPCAAGTMSQRTGLTSSFDCHACAANTIRLSRPRAGQPRPVDGRGAQNPVKHRHRFLEVVLRCRNLENMFSLRSTFNHDSERTERSSELPVALSCTRSARRGVPSSL
eukprot:gene29224-biopygen30389